VFLSCDVSQYFLIINVCIFSFIAVRLDEQLSDMRVIVLQLQITAVSDLTLNLTASNKGKLQ
jgi:hypothetical protein